MKLLIGLLSIYLTFTAKADVFTVTGSSGDCKIDGSIYRSRQNMLDKVLKQCGPDNYAISMLNEKNFSSSILCPPLLENPATIIDIQDDFQCIKNNDSFNISTYSKSDFKSAEDQLDSMAQTKCQANGIAFGANRTSDFSAVFKEHRLHGCDFEEIYNVAANYKCIMMW